MRHLHLSRVVMVVRVGAGLAAGHGATSQEAACARAEGRAGGGGRWGVGPAGPGWLPQSGVASGPGWLWQSGVGAGWLQGMAPPLRRPYVRELRGGRAGAGRWGVGPAVPGWLPQSGVASGPGWLLQSGVGAGWLQGMAPPLRRPYLGAQGACSASPAVASPPAGALSSIADGAACAVSVLVCGLAENQGARQAPPEAWC